MVRVWSLEPKILPLLSLHTTTSRWTTPLEGGGWSYKGTYLYLYECVHKTRRSALEGPTRNVYKLLRLVGMIGTIGPDCGARLCPIKSTHTRARTRTGAGAGIHFGFNGISWTWITITVVLSHAPINSYFVKTARASLTFQQNLKTKNLLPLPPPPPFLPPHPIAPHALLDAWQMMGMGLSLVNDRPLELLHLLAGGISADFTAPLSIITRRLPLPEKTPLGFP